MASAFTIHKYAPEHREGVRRICCDTGFLGNPVDELFEDRELFADFFTRYYLDYEPESTWVAMADGEVIGYLMGCRRDRYHNLVNAWLSVGLALRGAFKVATGRYQPHSRRFLGWAVTNGWREIPKAPAESAHFHFNVHAAWRNRGVAARMLFPFLDYLKENRVRRVCGQMVLPPDRRPPRVFERYGWKVYDTAEVTKFRSYREGVFVLATLWKELS